MFDVGDKVVYPHHGAGTVVSKDVKLVLGEEREYLTIKILHNEMTVNVPVDNAEKVGLRWVIDQEMVEVVVKVLLGGSTEMPKNWNRRFKHNRDKMKTGDIPHRGRRARVARGGSREPRQGQARQGEAEDRRGRHRLTGPELTA